MGGSSTAKSFLETYPVSPAENICEGVEFIRDIQESYPEWLSSNLLPMYKLYINVHYLQFCVSMTSYYRIKKDFRRWARITKSGPKANENERYEKVLATIKLYQLQIKTRIRPRLDVFYREIKHFLELIIYKIALVKRENGAGRSNLYITLEDRNPHVCRVTSALYQTLKVGLAIIKVIKTTILEWNEWDQTLRQWLSEWKFEIESKRQKTKFPKLRAVRRKKYAK